MDQWEYRVVRLQNDERSVERLPALDAVLKEIEVKLNGLGREGWELVSAGPYEGMRVEGIAAVLKRRLQT